MERKPKPSREYTVNTETTLLPFLLESVGDKSRNTVKGLLTRGQVLVDGRCVTRHDHRLFPSQQVTILPEALKRAALPFPVLWEDEEILVVDKPAGLLSMASDRERERTAYRQVTDYVRAKDPKARVFIVHRLDRDTSGVLLFAKSERIKRAFQDNWDTIVCRRGYTAVVEGMPPKAKETIRTFLQENGIHKVYSVQTGGKEAITHYSTVRQGKRYSLLEIDLSTGRKNQIRVHLSELGCPVAGDRTYGAKTDPLRRLCLHAHELTFVHPLTGKETTYRAELPRGFRKLI
ncbi:MAG: RluA family pseudouridine synthase [Ruminiclostridium sp.]|nr:RluA family pseudouridine synthase [Ruminiclostridium sp.]